MAQLKNDFIERVLIVEKGEIIDLSQYITGEIEMYVVGNDMIFISGDADEAIQRLRVKDLALFAREEGEESLVTLLDEDGAFIPYEEVLEAFEEVVEVNETSPLGNSLLSQGIGDGSNYNGLLVYTEAGSSGGAISVFDSYASYSRAPIINEETIIEENNSTIVTGTQQLTAMEDISDRSIVSGSAKPSNSEANLSYRAMNADVGSSNRVQGEYGHLVLSDDGSYKYHLDNDSDNVQSLYQGEERKDAFQIEVVDQDTGEIGYQDVEVTVVGQNDAPEVQLSQSSAEGVTDENAGFGFASPLARAVSQEPVTGNILVKDVDGDAVVAEVSVDPSFGSIQLVKTGSGNDIQWSYVVDSYDPYIQGLNIGDKITDTAVIKVSDGRGGVDYITVSVVIEGRNDAPVVNAASDLDGVVIEDGTGQTTARGKIIGEDADSGSILTYATSGAKEVGGKLEVQGEYGTFTLDPDQGSWTYVLDNDNPKVDALKNGQTLTDSFPITVSDQFGLSASETVNVIIEGSTDAPKITGDTAGVISVVEDSDDLAEGNLSDSVSGDDLKFVALGDSQYGNLIINADGSYSFKLDNSLSSVQGLAEDQTITETIPVLITDSAGNKLNSFVKVEITGQNDAPKVNIGASTDKGTAVEDSTEPVFGKVIGDDVDSGANLTYGLTNGQDEIKGQFGTFSLDSTTGQWKYVLNNNNSHVQKLGPDSAPLEDTITIIITDEHGAKVEHEVTVTIVGTDEAPYIDNAAAGSHVINAAEDDDTLIEGSLQNYISDPEGGTLTFRALGESQYGDLTINPDGTYEFRLDNSLDTVQEIAQGQKVNEAIVVIVEDEAGNQLQTTVTISISGRNDAPELNVGLSTMQATAVEGSITPVTGKVVSEDIDNDAVITYSVNKSEGTYGDLVINKVTGEWEYVLDPEKASSLSLGDKEQDEFEIVITDEHNESITKKVIIDVIGTDDAPLLEASGDTEFSAVEDGAAVKGNMNDDIEVKTNGSIEYISYGSSQYGTFVLNKDGSYEFTLNNSLQSVQALSQGQAVTEVIPVIVTDGSNEYPTSVTITINGANDPVSINTDLTISEGHAVEDSYAPVKGKVIGKDVDAQDTLTYSIDGDKAESGEFVGTYGKLVLNKDTGAWEYFIDQDKVQDLEEGDIKDDVFTVIVSDGNGSTAEQKVVIKVHGTDEAEPLDLVPEGNDTIAVVEDATKAVTGDMKSYVEDPEGGNLTFTAQGSSQYGTLKLNPDGTYSYVIDNKLDAVQSLAQGQVVVETIPVLVTDDAGNQLSTYVKVKITGQNDAPTVDVGTTIDEAIATEDSTIPVLGKIVGTDIDNDATLSYEFKGDADNDNKITGNFGTFTLDPKTGKWNYVLDNNKDQVQKLGSDDTLTDSVIVYVVDEHGQKVEHEIVVTIIGTDEAPYVDQTALDSHVVELTEDKVKEAEGDLRDFIKDPSGNTLHFEALGSSNYGTLKLNADGTYTFSLNNDSPLVQELGAGQSVKELIPVIVKLDPNDPNGPQLQTSIAVEINGTNDDPTIGDTTVAKGVAFEGDIAPVMGQIVGEDIDANAILFYTVNDADSTGNTEKTGSYGKLVIDKNTGQWEYILDADKAASLDTGDIAQESFTITVTDNAGAKTSQVITVDVVGKDDGVPFVKGIVVKSKEDGEAVSGTITLKDAEGDSLSNFAAQGDSQYGKLEVNSDGSYSFTIDNDLALVQSLSEGQIVTEVIPVKAFDEHGNEISTTITIEITGQNDAPVVRADASIVQGTVVEDSGLSVYGHISVDDVDALDSHSYGIKGDDAGLGKLAGKYGDLILDAATGKWEYILDNSKEAVQDLDQGDTLTDEVFTVVVTDSNGATVEQVVSITVAGTNEAPVLNIVPEGKDTIAVVEDQTDAEAGDFNDFVKDPEGDSLSFAALGNSDYGKLIIKSDGTYTFELDNKLSSVQSLAKGQVIVESVPILVTDASGNQLNTYIKVKITGTNDAPTIDVGDSKLTGDITEDVAPRIISGNIAIDDPDAGASHTYAAPADGETGGAQYGYFEIKADGSWEYRINNGHKDVQALDGDSDPLVDTITVTIKDEHGEAVTETITVRIWGQDEPNVPPTIDATTTTIGAVTEDGDDAVTDGTGGKATGTIVGVDANGDTLSYIVEGGGTGSYGRLSINSSTGAWTYTLDDNKVQYLGVGEEETEVFTVRVSDGNGGLVTQEVTITITGSNDAPIISALSNVKDKMSNVETQAEGSIVVDDLDINDDHVFTLSDGTDTSVAGTSDASLAGDYGTFTMDTDGNWIYTLDKTNSDVIALGKDEFLSDTMKVKVSDGNGGEVEKTIEVSISGTNAAPVVTGGTEGSVVEDTTAQATGTIEYTDVNGDTVSFFVSSRPAYGNFVIDDTGKWTYDLINQNAYIQSLKEGQEVFDYITIKVDDKKGGIVEQEIKIKITGTNDAPTFNAVTDTEEEMLNTGTSVEGVVVIDDIDYGDTHKFTLSDGTNSSEAGTEDASIVGEYGTFTMSADGNWVYTVDGSKVDGLGGDEVVTDTITVIVKDGAGAEIEREIKVTINGTNTAPVVTDGTAGSVTESETSSGTSVVSTSIIATDNEGDSLTYKLVDDSGTLVSTIKGEYGTITITASGKWTYTLDNGNAEVDGLQEGGLLTESFKYDISDGLASATGTIEVQINGTNDKPVIEVASEIQTGSTDELAGDSATGKINATDVDNNVAAGDVVFTLAAANDFTGGATYAGAVKTITHNGTDGNPIGTIIIDSAGNWTFTLTNPLHPEVEALAKDETMDIKFYVKAIDKHDALSDRTSTITITITGENDNPTITSAVKDGVVTEDGAVDDPSSSGGKAEGTIVYADVDTNDAHAVTIKESTAAGGDGSTYAGDYGSFKLIPNAADKSHDWEYVLDSSKVQYLGVNDTRTETITIMIDDGRGGTVEQQITVTINGTNDAPVIDTTADQTGSISKDLTATDDLTATGQLTATDVDSNVADTPLDQSHGNITFVVSTTEEGTYNSVSSAGIVGSNGYGKLIVDAGGKWTFVLDQSNDTVKNLGSSDKITETFYVKAKDDQDALSNEFEVITITINGTNDLPKIDGTSTLTDDVYEDGSIATEGSNDGIGTGTVVATDVNPNDVLEYYVFMDTGSGTSEQIDATTVGYKGDYGTLTLNKESGSWVYKIDNSNGSVQALGVNDTLTETIIVQVDDGSGGTANSQIVVTIKGTNDAPVIDTAKDQTGSVTKDLSATDDISATGQLAATDVDSNVANTPLDQSSADITFVVSTTEEGTYSSASGTGLIGSNGYGKLVVDASGKWTFVLDQSNDAVKNLGSSDTLTEVFYVKAKDDQDALSNEFEVISITIKGTNDLPKIDSSSTLTDDVYEDGSIATEGSNDGIGKGTVVATDVNPNDDLEYYVFMDTGSGTSEQIDATTVGYKGDYGTLTLDKESGAWVYKIDNNNGSVQALGVNDTLTETITVQVDDGSGGTANSQIVVTIHGTNDLPIIDTSADIAETVTEGTGNSADAKASGNLTATDVDSNVADTPLDQSSNKIVFEVSTTKDGADSTYQDASAEGGVQGANNYGSLRVKDDGSWEFVVNQSNSAVANLGATDTLTEVFYVKAKDDQDAYSSKYETITITINGTNDAPKITSTNEGVVVEDGDITEDTDDTDGVATGTIAVSDVNVNDNHGYFVYEDNDDDGAYDSTKDTKVDATSTAYKSEYGELILKSDGTWTYTINNSHSKVQALGKGETLTDTIKVFVDDNQGGIDESVITITINGTNDAPELASSVTQADKEGTVYEDSSKDQSATGTITFTDMDTSDQGKLVYSIKYTDASGNEATANVADITSAGLKAEYGTIKYDAATGKWEYIIDKAEDNPKVKALDGDEKADDSFTIIATDTQGDTGEQKVTITITGDNEAPVIEEANSTATWADSGGADALEEDSSHQSANEINVYMPEVTIHDKVEGQIAATDVNENDAGKLTFDTTELDGAPAAIIITKTLADGTTTTVSTFTSVDDFNQNNDHGLKFVFNSDGTWSMEIIDKDNANFKGLMFDEYLTIDVGVKVKDGHGGLDTSKISIRVDGGQQDLNYIHEYGSSNILEWITAEVDPQVTKSGEAVDYNEDGLGKSATIKELELPSGTEWTLTGSASSGWTLTHTDGYTVTMKADGSAELTAGDIPAGTLIDIPVIVTVKDGSTERTFMGTKLIATDHQSSGSFFVSDGSKEETAVMDYKTYVTTGVDHNTEGSPIADDTSLADATIKAEKGGRTYLHIIGNSGTGTTNTSNTINIATGTSASIVVADPGSFLFLEVRADSPELRGIGTDTINLGKGTVAEGTSGVEIQIEGGNPADNANLSNINNTITMDSWSFAGDYNRILLTGDSEKDAGQDYGNTTIDANITIKDQTFAGGETYFQAIGAGVYPKNADGESALTGYVTGNAVMTVGNMTSSGDAYVHTFLASSFVGDINTPSRNMRLIQSKVSVDSITANNNSEAKYSIAPIYGNVIVDRFLETDSRIARNDVHVKSIVSNDGANLTVSIAGINVGDLTSDLAQRIQNTMTIDKVAVNGGVLNFTLAGMVDGDVIGRNDNNPISSNSEALMYDNLTVKGISVAKGATLNFNAFGVASGNITNWEGIRNDSSVYSYSFGNIAGTANINIATFGGDIYNVSTDFPTIISLNGLTTSDDAELDMNIAVDTLGYATHHDSNDGTILMNGTFDLTGIKSDDPNNLYGIEVALSSMNAKVMNTDNGTTNFGVDQGFRAAHGSASNPNHVSQGGDIKTNSAEDFIIYGDVQSFVGDPDITSNAAFDYTSIGAGTLGSQGNITVYGDFKTLAGSNNITFEIDSIALGLGDDIVYSDFGHEKSDTSGYTGRISGSTDHIYLGGGSDTGYAGVGTEYWYGDDTGRITNANNASITGNGDQNQSGDVDVMYIKGTHADWSDDGGNGSSLEGRTTQYVHLADNDDATGVDYYGTSNIHIYDFEEIHFDDDSFEWTGSVWVQMT